LPHHGRINSDRQGLSTLNRRFVERVERRPIFLVPLIPMYFFAAGFAVLIPGALIFGPIVEMDLQGAVNADFLLAIATLWLFVVATVGLTHFSFVALRSLRFALFRAPINTRVRYSVEALLALCIMFAMAHYSVSALSNETAYAGIDAPRVDLIASIRMGEFVGALDWEPALGFLYFSVATFTTVGFGEIHPLSAPARALTILQMITGFAIIVLVISRIGGQGGSGES